MRTCRAVELLGRTDSTLCRRKRDENRRYNAEKNTEQMQKTNHEEKNPRVIHLLDDFQTNKFLANQLADGITRGNV